MTLPIDISGTVVRGKGEGAFFTRLDWFQEQCQDKLGFKPFPGTLNIHVGAEDLLKIVCLDQKAKIAFLSPDAQWCSAQAFPARVRGIRAAVIWPEKEVRVHGEDILEIISPVGLKAALKIQDGDPVTFEILARTRRETETACKKKT